MLPLVDEWYMFAAMSKPCVLYISTDHYSVVWWTHGFYTWSGTAKKREKNWRK